MNIIQTLELARKELVSHGMEYQHETAPEAFEAIDEALKALRLGVATPPPLDRGSKFRCTTCGTEWWAKSPRECPTCTPAKASTDDLSSPLRRLLNKVNKVTAPWRHGRRIDEKAMDELVERQIEIEDMPLSPMPDGSEPLCPRCHFEMKEYVLNYKCRNLKCNHKIEKFFKVKEDNPPTIATLPWNITRSKTPDLGDLCVVMKKEGDTWVHGSAQWIQLFGISQWSNGGWTHWKSVGNQPPKEEHEED